MHGLVEVLVVEQVVQTGQTNVSFWKQNSLQRSTRVGKDAETQQSTRAQQPPRPAVVRSLPPSRLAHLSSMQVKSVSLQDGV